MPARLGLIVCAAFVLTGCPQFPDPVRPVDSGVDGALDAAGGRDVGSKPDEGAAPSDLGPTDAGDTAGDTGPDALPPSPASVIAPVNVPGSACKDSWQDTGSKVSNNTCQVHLQSIKLGVGNSTEPDRVGCEVQAAGTNIRAYLYELACDDKANIGLSCSGSCGGAGVTRGVVEVTGQVGCQDSWRATSTNLGPGKTCAAFVSHAQLGVGSGVEIDAIGCRYNATTGDVETYLYELGCDDKAKISIRCAWICSSSSGASVGQVGTSVASQCSTAWKEHGSSLGAGKTCVAGMEYLKLMVGSKGEPNLFGCRFSSSTGKVELKLHEFSCNDTGIKLDCRYLCFN